jgi:hypothetical protein
LFNGGASSQANVIVEGRKVGGEDEERRKRKGKGLCMVWSLQEKWKGEVRRAVVRQDLNKP